MKRFAFLTYIVIITLFFCACSNTISENNSGDIESNIINHNSEVHISTEHEESDVEYYEDTTELTKEEQLSDMCDIVLASGYDNDDNFYELVANENEDETGAEIKIGVIKNNEWSVKLTNDLPFIGDDGWLSGRSGNDYASVFDEFKTEAPIRFDYIGNGCFCYNCDVLNGNNGKTFDNRSLLKNNYDSEAYVWIDAYTDIQYPYHVKSEPCINEDGKVLVSYIIPGYKQDLYLLDTNTMKTNKLPDKFNDSKIYPFSEGLFAAIDIYDSKNNGFYDENGKKVIDLSKYDIYLDPENKETEVLIFYDGKTYFDVDNGRGNIYEITIDKKGKVIE